jgi:SAM-dependent methyltransferase
MLEDTIVSLLAKSPADQYSLYRQMEGTSMSQLLKAISALQQHKIIRVAKYRKSDRIGLEVPIYSLSESSAANNSSSSSNNSSAKRLDIHNLLVGVTSERLVEYDFVARNLVSPKKQADILEIGSAGSRLAEAINEFGKGKWQVFRIDIAESGCDARMDARMTGFRNDAFDQVICVSTIEHIGIGSNGDDDDDDDGDVNTVKEVLRILKKGGSAIITVPYGKIKKPEHRVYNRHALSRLVAVDNGFSVAKKEFYCYDAGKWKRCNQGTADRVIATAGVQAPLHFHSTSCACLLLRKR